MRPGQGVFTVRFAAIGLALALAATPARGQSQNVRIVGQIGGYCRAVCVAGNIAYIGDGPSLTILDVSSSSPVFLSRVMLTDEIQDIAVTKGYAYVAAYNLEIVDVRTPSQPKRVSSFDTSDAAFGVATSGSLAFVADRYSGLQIIDVSNPAKPVRRGFYNTSGEAYKVALSGIYAYVADTYGGLQIIRVSNPASPVRVGSFSTRGYACDVAIRGSVAYVAYAAAYRGGGLQVVNVANPAAPAGLGYYDTSDYSRGLAVDSATSGILVYLASGANGFTVVDADNPMSLRPVTSFGGGGFAQAVWVSGDRIYLGDDQRDLQVFKVRRFVPSYQVSLIGSYATPGDGQAVRVSGGVAYVADRNFGLFTIDVSKPTKPMLLGSCRTLGQPWSVAVSNGYAYVAAKSGGLHVISVVNPALPVLVRSCSTPGEAEAVQVVGNLAYVGYSTGAGGGLQILNLTLPSSPTLRGSITLPDDVLDLCVSGGFAYVANDWTGLKVVDVRNPAAPVLRSSYPTQRSAHGVSLSGRTAYVAEYGGSLLVLDVSNPSSPTLRARCRPSDGAVFVSNGFAWLASGGLSVYDVINPAQPVPRGYSVAPGIAEGIHAAGGGLAHVAAWQEGLWIVQYTGNAPRIQAATVSDANANAVVDANDQLVLTLDRSVAVNTAVLKPSHFFLPVRGDSLGGTGFRVGVNPYNARQVVLTLGQGVRLRTAGAFSTGTLASGSPSGIDFATSIPFGAIHSLDGSSAVDGGVPGVDDSGVDVELALVRQLRAIGRAGGAVSVLNSADAAYRQHRLSVPANALVTTTVFLLRSPAQSLGVIGALQVQPGNPTVTFATPVTIRLEYREGDVDRESGFLESEMRVHQLVENPRGIFRYLPVRLPQTLNRAARQISVNVGNLNPNNSIGPTGSFAGLPIETVDERTINIRPSPGSVSRGAGPAVLTAGPGGVYTLHKIEIPGYEADTSGSPDRLVVTMRMATLGERESLCGGCSFPGQSGAVFTVTVNDASSRPVAFNSPVRLTVQFRDRPDPAETDLVSFVRRLAAASNMRLAKNGLAGGLVDFSFTTAPVQTVNVSQGTVTVENFVGLTGEDGCGTFGAVGLDRVAPAARWRHYH